LGESAASRYFKKNLYLIFHRNWRCSQGEIDLIAFKNRTLIFAEVKTRRFDLAESFSPLRAVDRKKQARIKQLSEIYIKKNRILLRKYGIRHFRYDILGIHYRSVLPGLLNMKIRHIKSAF